MDNRLLRSRSDAMIGGVCGGLAKYLRIDTSFVRLFFVLLAMAGGGIGVFIYLLLWIILPVEGRDSDSTLEETVRIGSQEIAERARAVGEDFRVMVSQPNPQAGLVIGGALIILGVIYLIRNLDVPWLKWLDFDIIWPVLLIMAGIALLRRKSGNG